MPNKYIKTANSLYYETIKGEMLDDFLAHGWYRMGPGIFTCHYIFYQEELFSTIWLRTNLKDYRLSKSLRKIDKKNKAVFTHYIEHYAHSEELEELYRKYVATFKGKLPKSLGDYMSGSLESTVYDTRIVKVYHEDKLIACSIIDIGQDTLASIFGMYDPDYRSYSLGLYTMMLEVEICLNAEMPYYYMGYFVPGNPRFDYKLRVGQIEYFDMKTEKWLSYTEFEKSQTPIEISRKKLNLLIETLEPTLSLTLNQNAYIDANIIEYFPLWYLEYPLIILIKGLKYPLEEGQVIITVFDIRKESYLLLVCDSFKDGLSNYNPTWLEKLDDNTIKEEYIIIKTLKQCKTTKPIERWVEAHL